jgi:HSP20 family protein
LEQFPSVEKFQPMGSTRGERDMAERQTSMTPAREQQRLSRTTPSKWGVSPMRSFQRLADEMDRMFDDFGFGGRWRPAPLWRSTAANLWDPDVDVYQKDDQLIIKADLPGLRKDEVSVEITDDAVTIQGQRKTEHEEERGGYFRSERSYGSFHRSVPLPEGAITDQAKASFRDGVLEITLPAPPAATKGRRLEISDGVKK